MRTIARRALAGAALALVAAGAPAEAACNGCGGAVAPGSAEVTANAPGRESRHLLESTCSYRSVPSAGSFVGSFSAEAHASSTYDPEINVAVACSLQTSAGNYQVSGNGTGSTPTDAYASAIQAIPANARVYRICINASATWRFGETVDSASAAGCSTPGLWLAEVLHVDLPGND
jgi:hypothetical protein